MKTFIIAVLVVAFVVGMLMFVGFSPRRFLERREGRSDKGRSDRLLEAVRKGDTAAALPLLTKGSYVPRGQALDLAAEQGDIPMMTLPIERGADPSGTNGANTPLYEAAWAGRGDAVRFLLDRGARLDVRLGGGLTGMAERGQR